MQLIKIVVVDDMKDLRDYFKKILNAEQDMQVVGEAENAAEAVEVINNTKPNVVLLDIQMETDCAGLEIIPTILNIDKDIKIIIITMHDDDEMMFEAFGMGATDYIIKNSDSEYIVSQIREIFSNHFTLPSSTTQKILNRFAVLHKANKSLMYTLNIASKLTKSELEILKMVNDGMKYVEIAKMRSVELGTIKLQVNKILTRFQYFFQIYICLFLYKLSYHLLSYI